MGFRPTKVESIVVHTPQEATELALRIKAFGQLKGERPLEASHVAHLKEKILGHEVLPFHWSVGYVADTGFTKRVDGQHSSEALLSLTPEEWQKVDFPLYVIWTDCTCDSVESLPVLFENFDEPWKVRKPKHIMGAHLAIYEQLIDVNPDLATRITSGIQWYQQGVQGLRGRSARRFSVIHDTEIREEIIHPFLVWCNAFLRPKNHRDMLTRPVVAAMYHTTLTGGDSVKTFWRHISHGEDANAPTVDSPTETVAFKLWRFLDKVGSPQNAEWASSVLQHFSGHTRPPEKDVFATCLRATKAHVDGRKIGEIFTPSKKRSVTELVDALYPLKG